MSLWRTSLVSLEKIPERRIVRFQRAAPDEDHVVQVAEFVRPLARGVTLGHRPALLGDRPDDAPEEQQVERDEAGQLTEAKAALDGPEPLPALLSRLRALIAADASKPPAR